MKPYRLEIIFMGVGSFYYTLYKPNGSLIVYNKYVTSFSAVAINTYEILRNHNVIVKVKFKNETYKFLCHGMKFKNSFYIGDRVNYLHGKYNNHKY